MFVGSLKPKAHPDDPRDDTEFLILRALSMRPGLNMSRLARVVNRSRGAVDHCLRRLVKAGTVHAMGEEGALVYVLESSHAGRAFALSPPHLKFLDVVARLDGATGADLVSHCGWSRSEVSRIGSTLDALGLLVSVKQGRNVVYLPRQS